jgi:preprotein translocase subunit YajC
MVTTILALSVPLAMAPPGGPGQSGSMFTSLVPFLLMFVIFYFLLIAPQRKKAKAHTAMLEALKAGDRVVTNGGIYGTVVGVDEQKVQLRVADQVKIDVAKHAIAGLQAES